ncbi:serine/threonine-protein kinase [Candidatus Oscillochloris fontis]|uniref:serine/threonine-protein kinase n=1 Tax=Candidatus Oscillochloris fontis TaxID=2496868 RepID=UPI00101D177F|nr:serine/threonine-protein kinase [Candidatus Oscillochloris fontis]
MSTTTNTITPLEAGALLGKFEMIKLVGRDGQAHVYVARVSHQPATPLAEIQRHIDANTASQELIERERICVIKLATPGSEDGLRDEHNYIIDPKVQHPRIIKLFSDPRGDTSTAHHKGPKGRWSADFRTNQGQIVHLPYIAIEYMPGGTLKHVLERNGRRPLPPAMTVQIALQVAEALEHLHTKAGLIHHDIHPSNITFRHPINLHKGDLPDCVLIDLAVADMPGKPRRTQVYGRRTYLPPERLQEKPGSHGPLVDVYGLGVVIYECLVGRLPHPGTDAITNIPYPLPPIREQVSTISPQLATLIDAAIAQDPSERSNLRQLIQALQHTPEARITTHHKPERKNFIIAAIAAGCLLLAVVLTVWLTMGGSITATTPTSTISIPTNTPIPSPTPTPTIVPTSTPSS